MKTTNAMGELRVGHAEREAAVERLQDAYAEGRLEHEEFDTRMHLAMTAKTHADIEVLFRDLAGTGGRPALAAGMAGTGPEPTGEDRALAALTHGLGYLTSFVGPLVMMVLSGKRSEYVRRHAVAALNFQLTLLILTIVTFGVGGILYAVTWIVAGIAACYALAGRDFRYPWTPRLVK
ncbi:DUF1707 and DUF4870 domain-containing protein [Actinomadura kijaniata]|uniref:DUF1707 and DUF4870 domain-containing protein n=1 Tax=Actinomadura kijaniata TaxID=46161 RepID=UPI003F1BFAA8